MHKKAGLIVGFSIILLAIIVIIAVSAKPKEKQQGKELNNVSDAETVVTQQQVVKEQPAINNTNSSVVSIDEETLPQPQITEQIGVVQNKTISLIDGELYYTLKMLVGDENLQLTYVVSKSGYNAVQVGTKCKVELACFTVANGSSYYLINNLSTLD